MASEREKKIQDIEKQLKNIETKKRHLMHNRAMLIEEEQKSVVDRAEASNFMTELDRMLKDYDEIMSQFDQLPNNIEHEWKQFEQNWKDWKPMEMVAWFAYILNKNKKYLNFQDKDTDEKGREFEHIDSFDINIDWDDVLNNVKQRQLYGNYLLICDESELERLGMKRKSIRKYLRKAIENLTNSTNKQNESDSKPDYICGMCVENVRNTVLRPCMHSFFCHKCMETYYKNNDHKCPICRGNIDEMMRILLS